MEKIRNLINLLSAESTHSMVSNNSQMSMQKKCYKIMLFPNNGFIYFTLFSKYLFDKATKIVPLEIYANKKQIKRAFDDTVA